MFGVLAGDHYGLARVYGNVPVSLQPQAEVDQVTAKVTILEIDGDED